MRLGVRLRSVGTDINPQKMSATPNSEPIGGERPIAECSGSTNFKALSKFSFRFPFLLLRLIRTEAMGRWD